MFTRLADEIVERIGMEAGQPKARAIVVYGVQHTVWAKDRPGHRWIGETVQVRFNYITVQGVKRFGAEMLLPTAVILTGFHPLGLVGNQYLGAVKKDEKREFKIYTCNPKPDVPALYYSSERTKSVVLFDLSMTEGEMLEWLYPNESNPEPPKLPRI